MNMNMNILYLFIKKFRNYSSLKITCRLSIFGQKWLFLAQKLRAKNFDIMVKMGIIQFSLDRRIIWAGKYHSRSIFSGKICQIWNYKIKELEIWVKELRKKAILGHFGPKNGHNRHNLFWKWIKFYSIITYNMLYHAILVIDAKTQQA